MNSVSPANPPLAVAPSLIKVASPAVPKCNTTNPPPTVLDALPRLLKVPLPPVGASLGTSPNCMKPPEVLMVPLLKVPLLAVESPSKMSTLLLVKLLSPAVAVLVNVTKPLLVKVALPAVEVPPKVMLVVVKAVKLPAVALLRKRICAPASSKAKFCTIPELFVMPAPLMVNVGEVPGTFMIVNALAPGLNTMPLSSALNAMKGRVLLEDANVAVSAGPFGTVVGVQLVAVNQSPVAGLAFHVALPAKLLLIVESRSVRMRAAEGRKARARERRGDSILLRWNDFHNTSDCMIFIVITSSCANESCRSRFLCGIVGLNWINGFMGWIPSFFPGVTGVARPGENSSKTSPRLRPHRLHRSGLERIRECNLHRRLDRQTRRLYGSDQYGPR